MMVHASIEVPASSLFDREAFPEFEANVRNELEREAAKRGEAIDSELVIISTTRESDGMLAERQAEFDRKCAAEGQPSHEIIRLGWIHAEASVPGPTNGDPPR